MRHLPHVSLLLLATFAACALLVPSVSWSQQIYLDLSEPAPKSAAAPANCSAWHELWPANCMMHHQDDYQDNGDSLVSACDLIMLDGHWFHVDWAGPTYFLSSATGTVILEPSTPSTGENPTCQTWIEVYPNHGVPFHVDNWQDNGDGVISPCDFIGIAGAVYHIDRIGLNIIIGPPPTPTKTGTWGSVKHFFGKIF